MFLCCPAQKHPSNGASQYSKVTDKRDRLMKRRLTTSLELAGLSPHETNLETSELDPDAVVIKTIENETV